MSNKSREALLAIGVEALIRAAIDLGWDARELGIPKERAKDDGWSGAAPNVRQMVANVLAAERPDRACDHGSNYLDGDNWHCLICPHVWPVADDPEGWGLARPTDA